MDARAYLAANAREFIDDLKQWLAIPSISADPEHRKDVRRSAEWLAAHLSNQGFPVAEVWDTAPDGLPAVFAEWPADNSDAPKVLIYGHHDVQPVEPLEEWDSPPFEPAERLHAMAALLAGLHDDAGRVTLPRFYNSVLPLSAQERELFARLPFDEKEWLAEAGQSGAASGEEGFTTLERIWARPTAEVNGMWGGHTGPGGKTIIPAAAHAKVSFRLVADQDPADVLAAFEEYVRAATPAGLAATVTAQPAVRPSHSPITSPAVRAGRRAMERAFGREVLFTKEGGSGPEADLADILAAPLVFIAIGLDSDRPHAPNERIDLSLLLRGAEVSAYLWEELATAGSDLT